MEGFGYDELDGWLGSADVAGKLVEAIRVESRGIERLRLMEVCGTHTVAIRRAGIPSLLPPNLTLLSGPGCPVCVTPNSTVDRAIALARQPTVILTTFGDMFRVPGSTSSLAQTRAEGADVRVVYSPMDALKLAGEHPDREVVFLGVGFETTAPTVAATLRRGPRRPGNFTVLTAHKLVPPALAALCNRDDFSVDGFLCPGHVSTIIGSDAYRPVAEQRGVPCVIAGFGPVDILLAILMLIRQARDHRAEVEVEYQVAVRPQGNRRALDLMQEVFQPVESEWRGLGVIPSSGLRLQPAYREADAGERFDVEVAPPSEHAGCRCGEVLAGAIPPGACELFAKRCTPAHPVGPCMVSSEGACAASHKYDAG